MTESLIQPWHIRITCASNRRYHSNWVSESLSEQGRLAVLCLPKPHTKAQRYVHLPADNDADATTVALSARNSLAATSCVAKRQTNANSQQKNCQPQQQGIPVLTFADYAAILPGSFQNCQPDCQPDCQASQLAKINFTVRVIQNRILLTGSSQKCEIAQRRFLIEIGSFNHNRQPAGVYCVVNV